MFLDPLKFSEDIPPPSDEDFEFEHNIEKEAEGYLGPVWYQFAFEF